MAHLFLSSQLILDINPILFFIKVVIESEESGISSNHQAPAISCLLNTLACFSFSLLKFFLTLWRNEVEVLYIFITSEQCGRFIRSLSKQNLGE